MTKANKILLVFLLVSALYNLACCAEPSSPVSFSVKSTITFADVDKNGVIDAQENKAYESEKLKIFDTDHDGKLNEAEKTRFERIDKIISAGGKSLEELSGEDKQLYKKWRAFILSLIQKSEEKAASERERKTKANAIVKCYPDKVCDDPSSPYYGTTGSPDTSLKNNLTIFYAAGLNAAMQSLIKEFEKVSGGHKIILESSDSILAVRKVTELNKKADVILVADESLIKNMLIPQYTDWYIRFYKDSIVLAFTDKSKYTNEIDAQNWYNLLLRKDVRFGYANPELAPIGYKTLLLWKLADLYYKDKPQGSIYVTLKDACPKENVLPDVAELLPLLESLSLDYAFVYESTAKQHNLKFIQLPKEINLGSPELADTYKQVEVEIERKEGSRETIIGAPITFALTILKDADNFSGAVKFVKLLLGSEGERILKENGQELMQPSTAYNLDKVPEEIRNVVSLKNNE
jgi:molybdate/tungstate transport system substrate-binding protein